MCGGGTNKGLLGGSNPVKSMSKFYNTGPQGGNYQQAPRPQGPHYGGRSVGAGVNPRVQRDPSKEWAVQNIQRGYDMWNKRYGGQQQPQAPMQPQQVAAPVPQAPPQPQYWGDLESQWLKYSANPADFAPGTDMAQAKLNFMNAGGYGYTPGAQMTGGWLG
jgi:hypothetical protein